MTSFENLTNSNSTHCCMKRKISEHMSTKLSQPNDLVKALRQFANARENFRASTKAADHDSLKAVPESIKDFFVLYVKQVNAISDLYECLDLLLENSKPLFDGSKILKQVHKLSKNSVDGLNSLTNSVVEELARVSETLFNEPPVKSRRIETSKTSKDNTTNFVSEDDDIDFAGSDIDLQLEEVVDKVCESTSTKTKSPSQLVNCAASNKFESFSPNGGKNSNNLNYDPDGYVKVFIDGSCSFNGRSNAQAGIGVWFGDCNPLNISERARGVQTNNNAEIQAATKAILKAKSIGVGKLRLYTDSQFLINCMTKWIFSWKQNHWYSSSNKPVVNKDSLMELDKVIPLLDAVDWRHVEAHKGIHGNESADSLAKAGAKKM